jgi:hypothetical protein
MRDCPNVEMREQLPELMHGVLRADVAAEMRAHVAQCADCRAELELLERVRSVLVAPSTPVDTTRILAKLPRYQRPSLWARAARSTQLRAAAAILLMVGGYVAVSQTRGDVTRPDSVAVTPTTGTAELAIGDTFQDLTDSDLKAMLDEIAKIEAVTPDATEDDTPAVIQRNGAGSGEENEG